MVWVKQTCPAVSDDMGNEITSVKTSNGTYYVSVTRKQAEKQDMYKKKAVIDFSDLDTDNGDDLSLPEILNGAKNKTRRNIVGGFCCHCRRGNVYSFMYLRHSFNPWRVSAGGTAWFGTLTGAAAVMTHDAYGSCKEGDEQLEKLDKKR